MLKSGWVNVIREKDLRHVDVKPFCLDKTEVTVEAYGACVSAQSRGPTIPLRASPRRQA